MADYQRYTERFLYTGLSCFPPDGLPPGKFPYVKNVRSYAEGEIQPRNGLDTEQTVGATVHSLGRLNDATNFNGGVPAVRIIGAAGDLYVGIPSNPTPPVFDTGYSGNPLSMFSAQPPRSPRPWAYIADEARYQKFTTTDGPFAVGIAQPSDPSTEPAVAMDQQHISAHDIQTSAAWTAAGTVATVPTTTGTRVNTTISQILYDDGVTNTGYASIVPANTDNITTGTLLTVGNPPGAFENALVTDITIAVADTTVASIIYDSGTTGLCTIQPAGSLGVGQLDAPGTEVYRARAIRASLAKDPFAKYAETDYSIAPEVGSDAPTRRIRQVDFPVNAIIVLNAAETVRILSVAVGPDGVQSFRCFTSTTISAGDTITGLAAFRIFLSSTWSAGDGLLRQQLENILTYVAPLEGEKARMTGGIQTAYAINLAQFSNGQAVLPEDELHVAVNVDRLTEVVSVRVYIDVNKGDNDFLQNYYFHEWRASDIISAIQGTNTINVTPLVDARKTVVANQQLEQANYLDARRQYLLKHGGRLYYVAKKGDKLRAKQPPALSAIATQLALGNSQWIDLRVKIGTLTRVGTDTTRTLANAAAFEVLIAAEGPAEDVTPDPITVKYSDLQIYGGGGVDVGEAGDPIVYSYRYRSSLTGAVSNPSPPSRGGVIPRRQDVLLTPTISTDPQVDRIDWFRFGGSLTQHTYLGTGDNTVTPFRDRYMDSQIDGGEIIDYDSFQPWPLQDIPHTGICKVAGSAVEWVSGDTFDTSWAPGSIILVNGRATSLYSSPPSTTLLHVVDNVGSGDAVEFNLPGPTLLSQFLGRCWGDYQGFWFACGDTINPGTLYWTNGNNVETTSDTNSLIVTSGSEALQNGGIYNTFPFVASSEQFYAILLDPNNQAAPMRAIRTPCGRGFWTPWAFAIAPEGVYFLAADGIALTQGGSPAELITSPDLRAIFPKDGASGETTNGIPAPDMTQTTKLRLSYIAGWLYFDYVDGNGASWTLLYDTFGKRFYLDSSDATGMRVRLEEPGAGVYNQIIGSDDGRVFQYEQDHLSDDGSPIPWQVSTRYSDAGIPRIVKQYGDVAVNLSGGGSAITFQPTIENGTVTPLPTVATPGAARETVIIGVPDGELGENLGLIITGTTADGDTSRPRLFWWEPSFLPKADVTTQRVTDWEDLGYIGSKFVQGIVIRANTYGQDKLIQIQKDGVTALDFTINHDGELQIAYPLAPEGWTPFVAELVRIASDDDVDWQLLGYRFVWEPAPELATQWETQFTALDYAGYGTVADMVFAYESTDPMILLFFYDDRTQTYILPATGGNYLRYFFKFCPNKERAVKFRWTTETPARVYKRDVSMRTQAWGVPGGYHIQQPFGGPSFNSGAEI